MRARNRFGARILLSGVVLAAGAAVAAEPAASANDCFKPAFKSGDADAVAACYAEDAIIWFPGGPMASGRAAIRDGFAGYFSHVTIKDVVFTEIGREAMGVTQATWGTYSITLVDKVTQAESVEAGRYTDVQKKVDGRWVYVVDHPSDDPGTTAN